MDFEPATTDILFALECAASRLEETGCAPGLWDEAKPLLDGAGAIARNLFAPLNRSGDVHGAILDGGHVRLPDGFPRAYEDFRNGGWPGLQFESRIDGAGVSFPVATAASEIWASANTVLGLLLMPIGGAVTLLDAFGSEEQKTTYLPKLVSGEWTATMAMTEPQAGTDLGAIRCQAVKQGDHYLLRGEKSFISFADHDLVPNIVQFVLARTPGTPRGTKGLSLFLVPKVVTADAGTRRNDVRYLSLEKKLGLHAMPTGTLVYGENGGASAYLIGEENRGIEYMFALMNRARLSIGMLGLANAERAYQAALSYARQRVQGRAISGNQPDPVTIDHHPDVRRMLMSMKSRIDAMRLLGYHTAALIERSRQGDAANDRGAARRLALLTPIVKAWLTETGFSVVSQGIQIHGGMGYAEETGVAQILREARVHPIYEGTTGVQAMDLALRKVAADGGETMRDLLDDIEGIVANARLSDNEDLSAAGAVLEQALADLRAATVAIVETAKGDPATVLAGSTTYLELAATVIAGGFMASSVLKAEDESAVARYPADFLKTKAPLVRFFADHVVAGSSARLHAIRSGTSSITDATVDLL